MKKAEINNEIVKLRKFVRQARVCVSSKLVREAKSLRTKRGDEKQRERNANRADRLISEVFKLKKMRDDDITIFGIANTEILQKMLEDPSSDDCTRILAKVVLYKNLYNRIVEFTLKFPDYVSVCKRLRKKPDSTKHVATTEKLRTERKIRAGKHVQATNKQKALVSKNEMENQIIVKSNHGSCSDDEDDDGNDKIDTDNDGDEIDTDNDGNDIDSDNDGDDNDVGDDDDNDNDDEDTDNDDDDNDEEDNDNDDDDNVNDDDDNDHDDGDNDDASKNKNVIGKKRKRNQSRLLNVNNPVRPMTKKTDNSAQQRDDRKIHQKRVKSAVKVISGIATVKRLTELLESDGTLETSPDHDEITSSRIDSAFTNEEIMKESDDFFMTSDGNNPYLSVVIPKPNGGAEDDEDDTYIDEWTQFDHRPRSSFDRDRRFTQKQPMLPSFPKKDRSNFTSGNLIDKRHGNVLDNNIRRKNDVGMGEKDSLHPSWEARRKQQEIMKQGFQGKKIVFEDV